MQITILKTENTFFSKVVIIILCNAGLPAIIVPSVFLTSFGFCPIAHSSGNAFTMSNKERRLFSYLLRRFFHRAITRFGEAARCQAQIAACNNFVFSSIISFSFASAIKTVEQKSVRLCTQSIRAAVVEVLMCSLRADR